MTWLRGALVAFLVLVVAAFGAVYLDSGVYGVNQVFRHGGTVWVPVARDSAVLSPAVRAALASPMAATAGPFHWHQVAPGFETAEVPIIANNTVVDHLNLARIDSARYQIAVRTRADGTFGIREWMDKLGAVLVVNGSYYAWGGVPATPVVSAGVALGPTDYDAKAGAFIAVQGSATVQDLAHQPWRPALRHATDAMVSYPLLLSHGQTRPIRDHAEWLANRSFVGEDRSGRIVIGTTADAYFSLTRFAAFLKAAPLDLDTVLNLDGGPVACQAIRLNGYSRTVIGTWEVQADSNKASFLAWPFGTVAMPVVLAVFPRK